MCTAGVALIINKKNKGGKDNIYYKRGEKRAKLDHCCATVTR
jgi:hypothetical protein